MNLHGLALCALADPAKALQDEALGWGIAAGVCYFAYKLVFGEWAGGHAARNPTTGRSTPDRILPSSWTAALTRLFVSRPQVRRHVAAKSRRLRSTRSRPCSRTYRNTRRAGNSNGTGAMSNAQSRGPCEKVVCQRSVSLLLLRSVESCCFGWWPRRFCVQLCEAAARSRTNC